MIHRCEGAQTNGFENIGLFAAAVLAGNFAGLPAPTLNLLSGGYVVSRVLYNWIYINSTRPAMALARTGMWSVGIGILLALGLTRLMSTVLYGVKPSDPITYAAVAFGLGCVAMLACFIPAQRATKVDPMVALRYE